MIDTCSKLMFCSKIAQKGKILLEVVRSLKSCSKSQKLPESCRAQSGQAYPRANISQIPESGLTYLRLSWNLPLIAESDDLYFKRYKCAKNNKQTNKQAKQKTARTTKTSLSDFCFKAGLPIPREVNLHLLLNKFGDRWFFSFLWKWTVTFLSKM